MKTFGATVVGVVTVYAILVRLTDEPGEQDGDSSKNVLRLKKNVSVSNIGSELPKERRNRLRRMVYRVNSNITSTQQHTREREELAHNLEWGRRQKYDQKQKEEEDFFWQRSLQQSVSEKNEITVVAKPTDSRNENGQSTNMTNSTNVVNPPDRFDFFNRGDNYSGHIFDMYALFSRKKNNRLMDWVGFRNEDHIGKDRFRRSVVRSFQRDRVNRDLSDLSQPISTSQNKQQKENLSFITSKSRGREKFRGSALIRLADKNGARYKSKHVVLLASMATKNGTMDRETERKSNLGRPLDFFVAGFPKCGTTTLLYAFSNHSETSISNKEQCDIIQPGVNDTAAFSKLNSALSELEPSAKFGIKCPTGLRTWQGLERLKQHSPHARLVIGVRHPVVFFQSFYNYRVTEIYDKGSSEPIPPAESLLGSNQWKGVSTDMARFELFLLQLGKTKLTKSQHEELINRPNMMMNQTPFKIFLYSIEQLEDKNVERGANFRRDMQDFLQLQKPFPEFGRENMNHFVGNASHPETINICEEQFDEMRGLLVAQGMRTKQWFQEQFLFSSDVIVGGKMFFLELLGSWGTDPCETARS